MIRSMFYADVLELSGNESDQDVIVYPLMLDEEYRPDLVSHRVYGTVAMRWAVSLIAGVEDQAEPLPVGTTLRLPSSAWVRERLRHYVDGGGI
ncbi:MAG: hypothetical protein ACRC8Q_12125 [Aeromonas sp.]